MKTQMDNFIDGILGRAAIRRHALTPPGGGWTIMLCGAGGWGTDIQDEVNCPDCIAIREGRAEALAEVTP